MYWDMHWTKLFMYDQIREGARNIDELDQEITAYTFAYDVKDTKKNLISVDGKGNAIGLFLTLLSRKDDIMKTLKVDLTKEIINQNRDELKDIFEDSISKYIYDKTH